jgi:predicted N-acetyltransferase YhbS
MKKIFQEAESDFSEIEVLLDLTFGSGRNALSSYRYREGVRSISELCFVFRDEFDVLVGVIRFWPILIGFQRLPGLLLGPLGIHPTRQGEGLGEALISKGIDKANETGWSRVVLVGDESYYGRFGFSKSLVKNIYLHDNVSNERFLGNELTTGSMASLRGPLLRFCD